MNPLLERLQALGLVQASKLERSLDEKKAHNGFDEAIKGINLTNSLGSCFLSTSTYPWKYRHGKVVFENPCDISLITAAGRANNISNQTLSNLLFLDTETTGLAGGTGTFAFLVGLGFFTNDGFELKQYIIRDPNDESAMLLEIANLLEQFTGIVSFNGKAFDVPLLKTRYVLNKLPHPFDPLSHLDLLFLSRKIWKNRLKSRALQDLEQEIMEIPRSQEEIPGWMIPEVYFEYLRTGNAERLKGVVYHNGMDIVSLAALFLYISNSFEQLFSEAEMHPIDYYSYGQILMDLGLVDIAKKMLIKCAETTSLPAEMQLSSLKRIASSLKQQEEYSLALEYWQRASDLGDIDSSIELAKYFEHNQRDIFTAIKWTDMAESFLTKRGYHNYQDRQLRKEIIKRKDRLIQKLKKEKINVSTENS